MITYDEVMNKKNELKNCLVENFELLGTKCYVDLINDLEEIVYDMRLDKFSYTDAMNKLIDFEEELNKILEELKAGLGI